METLLECIASVQRIEADPKQGFASRHLAHLLLEEAANELARRVLGFAAAYLASDAV